MERILIISNSLGSLGPLEFMLKAAGYEVQLTAASEQEVAVSVTPNSLALIFDLGNERRNGLKMLRNLRNRTNAPILVLTEAGNEVDRIMCLEIGGDDIMEKPAHPQEVVARLRAIRRRMDGRGTLSANPTRLELTVGDVKLDRNSWVVSCLERIVSLTVLEFNIMALLLERHDRVVPRSELFQIVFDRPYDPCDRSIDVHICNLRAKLGSHPDGTLRIKTIRGVGYQYATMESAAASGQTA
jgi:two-component system response regulator CpxR